MRITARKTEFIISGDKLFVKSFDASNDTFSLFRHTVTNGVVSAAEMLDTSIRLAISSAQSGVGGKVTGPSLGGNRERVTVSFLRFV